MVVADGTTEEKWWVLRAQSGDIEALNLLFTAVQPPLLGYINNVVQNQALSEEILQETLLLIYRKLRWLEDPRLFRPWAYRIASREVWRHLKKEKKHTQASIPEGVFDLEIPATQDNQDELQIQERLPQFLSHVSPASRAVLALHYLQDMNLSEVAEVLDISVGTVKSRLSYGLAILRQRIKNPERIKE